MKKSLLSGATILAIAVLMSGCVAQNGGGNMNSANNPPQQNPQPDPQDPNQPDPQDQGNGNGSGIQLDPGLVGKLQPQPQPGINPNDVPILVEENPVINPGGPVMISQQPNNGLNPVKVKPGKVNIGQQQAIGQMKPGKLNGGVNKKPILIQP
nr:hypothetical protein [uncultured Dongia sp.]